MHATFAYLNAAGARRADCDSGSAFMQVMDSLLANTHGASRGHNAHDGVLSRGGMRNSAAKRSLLRFGNLDRA